MPIVNYDKLQNNLQKLDGLYSSSQDPILSIMYSKLALLEFAGWLEETFGKILHYYVDKHITNKDCEDLYNNIIGKTYGLNPEKILKLFCQILGCKLYEKVYIDLKNKQLLPQFLTILKSINTKRNDAAHTSVNILKTYDAPSVILSIFNQINPAVQELEKLIKRVRK